MALSILGEFFLTLSLVGLFLSIFIKDRHTQIIYTISAVLLVCSFFTLSYAHLISDMSLLVVLENTHKLLPWYFKLGAIWSSHEGSMLLWIVILGCSVLFVAPYLNTEEQNIFIKMHSFLMFGFVLFLIIASNPFKVVQIAQKFGDDLNPVLQDPSLLIHPPLLYVGTAVSVIPFHLSLLILFRKNLSIDIAKLMYKSSILSWIFLTLGLALGSLWAYYELGWGGFWFWDPVETIALIPWLLLTALIHQIIRYNCSNNQQYLVVLYGFLPFLSVLLGTTLVRSGLLTSVHSFAFDLNRGFLLFTLFLLVLFFVAGFCVRFLKFQRNKPLGFLEYLINYQGLILCALSAVLLAGVLTPLVLGFLGVSISLEFEFFNTVFFVFATFILGLMAFSSNTSLQESFGKAIGMVFIMGCLAVVFMLFVVFFSVKEFLLWILIGWIILGTFWNFSFKSIKLLKLAMIFAHVGIAILMIGIMGATYYKQSFDVEFKKHTLLPNKEISIKFLKEEDIKNPLWLGKKLHLKINDYSLTPEIRHYFVRSVVHNEVSIAGNFLSHYYATILNDRTPYFVRIEYKPFVNLIWIGSFIMALGGVIGFLVRFRKNKTIG